jgi:hypothetical protein
MSIEFAKPDVAEALASLGEAHGMVREYHEARRKAVSHWNNAHSEMDLATRYANDALVLASGIVRQAEQAVKFAAESEEGTKVGWNSSRG